jgi:putative hydrolase of the HAD superfamily
VLFDLDDTLCDYAAARLLRLRIAFAGPDAARPRVDPDVLERMIAASLAIQPHGADHFADLFAAHGIADPAAAAEAARWYRENRFHGLRMFPDAAATIAAVRRWGGNRPTAIGIVTNGPADVQREKIRLLGVEALADFALVSGEFGAWKPDRAIFAEALRLAGVGAADALMVGDSLAHDVAGARDAGIRSVWVNRAGRERAVGDPEPDHEIRDVAELLALPRVWRRAGRGGS